MASGAQHRGTAVGTGINAEQEYPVLMVKHLREITGLHLEVGKDRVQLMPSMGDVRPSAARSGLRARPAEDRERHPAAGVGPAHRARRDRVAVGAAGLEHHAGKVNPSIAEMVNRSATRRWGLDLTVALAAEAGQLELNVMMPVMAHNIVFAMIIVGNATRVLAEKCVAGIEADEAQCAYWLERSPRWSQRRARDRLRRGGEAGEGSPGTGLTVKELVLRKRILEGAKLEKYSISGR